MSMVDASISAQVKQLNRDYIRALDKRDMQGWLNTFVQGDASYVCISRENEERGLPIAYMLDDCYERIQDRVTQVVKIQADAMEHYQPRHFVQVMDIEPAGDDRYRVQSNFTLYYTPFNTGKTDLLVAGEYIDEVVINGTTRLKSRRAVLDTNVVPRYVVYPV